MIKSKRLRSAAIMVALACNSLSVSANTAPSFESDDRYKYTILSQDIGDVLVEFGSSFGISMNIDGTISGRVSNFQGVLTGEEFLERLASEYGLSWYYDGVSIYVTPASANRSVVVDFKKVPPDVLEATLQELGVSDDRFKLRTTNKNGIGVLTGPPRYIQLVENAFTLLEKRQTGPKTLKEAIALSTPRSNILIIRGDSAQVWQGKNAGVLTDLKPKADAEDQAPAEQMQADQTVSE